MNASHPWADRLSEYIDGELPAADVAALEQHLAGCAVCRSGVADLRRVRDQLRSDTIRPADAPSSAEWAAIARRISSRRRLRAVGMGAALLAAAAVIVLLIGRPRPDGEGATPFAAGIASPAYVHATDDLEAVLRDNRSRLRPETVRALERSLAMIDSAIVQAQRALAADPANDYVIRHIDRLRGSRLATLRDAVALVQL